MGKEAQESTLNDFTGFTADTLDFFGENSQGTDVETENLLETIEKEKVIVSTKEKEANETVETVDEKEIFDWGQEDDSEEEQEEIEEAPNTENTSNKKEKVVPVVINSKSTLDFLKSKGYVEYELPDGKTELTETEAEDLLEDSWEKSLDAAIAETVQDLDPIAKAILKVAKDGGDVRGMIKNLATNLSVGIDKTTDMSQEANQVLALTIDLKEQGFDDEYIDTHIQTLKTTDKLEAMSKKSSERIVSKQEATQVEAEKQARAVALQNKESQRAYKNNLISHLGENKTIAGVNVNKKEIENYASYIADPTILLENGSTVSELQKDLFAAMSDKNNLFLFAKMLKGKEGKLDFSFIANKEITNFSNNVRKNIQNAEEVPTRAASGSSHKKRSLADHF